MSYEKLGAINWSNGKAYSRKLRGINLPTDFMTDDEIAALSSEVKIYYKEDNKNEKKR